MRASSPMRCTLAPCPAETPVSRFPPLQGFGAPHVGDVGALRVFLECVVTIILVLFGIMLVICVMLSPKYVIASTLFRSLVDNLCTYAVVVTSVIAIPLLKKLLSTELGELKSIIQSVNLI